MKTLLLILSGLFIVAELILSYALRQTFTQTQGKIFTISMCLAAGLCLLIYYILSKKKTQ